MPAGAATSTILNQLAEATFYSTHTIAKPLIAAYSTMSVPEHQPSNSAFSFRQQRTFHQHVSKENTFPYTRQTTPNTRLMKNFKPAKPDLNTRDTEDHSDNHQLIEHLNQRIADLQEQVERHSRLADLGNLAAALSHDIRSALNIIKNLTELSAEATAEIITVLPPAGTVVTEEDSLYIQELAADIAGNSEHISNNSSRAAQIVNTVLMSSHGRREQYQQVAINQLIENHARLAYQAARTDDSNFNVSLRYEFDDQVADIIATPSDIGRVIINIISNSCHATNARQAVEDDYSPIITITTTGHTDHVVITVADNGIGIPKPIVERIFTRFFTTKPPTIGTGLGLAITQEIIHRHGGTIAVQSEQGSHTIFTIQLPRIPEEFQR